MVEEEGRQVGGTYDKENIMTKRESMMKRRRRRKT